MTQTASHSHSTITLAKQFESEGTLLRNQGRGQEAAEKYTIAKDYYLEAGLLAQAAGCQHMKGVSYKVEGLKDKALEALNIAISDYVSAGDILGSARVKRDIGIMYEYVDMLSESLNFLISSERELRALSRQTPIRQVVGESASVSAELGITLAKLGLVYTRLDELEKAQQYFTEALSFIRIEHHPFYEMSTLLSLGGLYNSMKRYEDAITVLEACIGIIYDYSLEEMHTRRLAQIWGLLAHAYLGLGVASTARRYAKKSLIIIDSLSDSAKGSLLKDVGGEQLRQLIASS